MLRAAILFTLLGTAAIANPTPLPQGNGTTAPALATEAVSPLAVDRSLRPVARRAVVLPDARWANKGDRRGWTLAIVRALRAHAASLPDTVPRDIATWCPGYPTASREEREAFWVGLVSSLAWHESTHRPAAVGGGGQWYGLTQILPSTARLYRCKAKSGEALKDPEDNLSCALRIMARTVPRDGVISAGMRGVAADWGPFHSKRKREDMRAWVRSQEYCTGMPPSLRPVARPAGIGIEAKTRDLPPSKMPVMSTRSEG
ncbi:transglycosylase SLT domain-containing protein [Thetidibacter halocola]|uniref:Transglycosylase SLT domain-containing protein n=1 Tax=Thetidibacter halocola TaxID=2827239 RepID=A0A8J7WDI8_9RHOB|nr:transglycosylase SLT domain-containing protein [Thetidibacter halocola]MBS0123163.1 transglycosylase SLT domain-containing protein [Thetidibacter halocola]